MINGSGHHAFMNWSGGKDSAFCLFRAFQGKAFSIKYLLTSLNENNNKISMHGVCEELLDKQANLLGIPLIKMKLPQNAPAEEYEKKMLTTLGFFKDKGIRNAMYGDIFLQGLREYREQQLKKISMNAIFPLWNYNTSVLAKEFIDLGFKAIIVCVDERQLDKSFTGREYTCEMLADLPENVDPCGENGEFHTFVYEAPNFAEGIRFKKGEIVYRKYSSDENNPFQTGFWYCNLGPLV